MEEQKQTIENIEQDKPTEKSIMERGIILPDDIKPENKEEVEKKKTLAEMKREEELERARQTIPDDKLTDLLHLAMEPVGIYFGNTEIDCDLDASPEKRNCVIPLLIRAARGTVISLNEESCNCAGGTVGCCFGDGFTKKNPQIHKFLSQGFGEDAPEGMPRRLKVGERFFCSEELAMKWRNSLPYSEKACPRIVFAPLSRWKGFGKPDLVYVFADADQISALVTLLGFHTGRAINTITPYGAACQSILFAADQIDKDEPMAVLGLFDISQRRADLAQMLSITMPMQIWEEINKDLHKTFFYTDAWKAINERLKVYTPSPKNR